MTFREISSLTQIKQSLEGLQSVPPGCQNQTIKGFVNIRVQNIYLNACRQETGMKCKLWGMPGEGIRFEKVTQTTKQMRLSIRSKIESLSKYFNDMRLLCIQIFTLLQLEKEEQILPIGLEKRKKVVKENRQIGWIFVNIQRYIINHILSNFQEVVSIVDLKKQKIGEAKLILTVQMFREELSLPEQLPASAKMLQQPKKQASNYFEDEQKFFEPQIMPEKQQKKRNILPNRDPGYRVSVQTVDYEVQLEKHRNRVNFEHQIFAAEIKKKGKAQLFLEQYQKNKPLRSQLSIIRQKYGFNLPSVEIMKLKYDQAALLTNYDKKIAKDEQKLNLLLKSIKMQGKQKADFLMIYCEQRQKRLKTQTKLILPEQVSNQKMEINYLYTIPNNPLDTLIFQLKEAHYQTQVSQLFKTDKIQIKNKNGKRICVIQFSLISQDGIKKSKLAQVPEIKKNKDNEEAKKKLKVKENAYVNVLNWKQEKIVLKNPNFGTVKASKLLFQISQQNANHLTIELEHENKEKSILQLSLAHLFKQENYLVNGTSVKVITSKGQLPQILTLIERLQPQKIAAESAQKPVQQEFELSESLKQLVKAYVSLQESQNFECNQLLQELATSPLTSTKKMQKFASIIHMETLVLKKILEIHFSSKFELFYLSFKVFHDWSHKYKIIQKKIKSIIASEPIRHYLSKTVKKIKKSSELMFGLIPTNFFLNQLTKQALENDKIVIQKDQNQIEHQQIGKLIVLVFERYFNKCLKISQLQEFIRESKSFVNLNTYLLSKITFEIKNQRNQFDDYLNSDSENFINIFYQRLHNSGQLGLAKLLLTSEDEYAESSVLSTDQNLKKYTQENLRKQTEFRQEDYKNKTEQSKDPFHKKGIKTQQDLNQRHNQLFQKQEEEENQEIPPNKNITVVIKNAKVFTQNKINQIVLTSQYQTITLSNQQLAFPKAIELIENVVYGIEVKTQDSIYEGVFLASAESKRAKLYRMQKQCGFLQLFTVNAKNKSQESQIVVKLTTQQKYRPVQALQQEQSHKEYLEKAVDIDLNSAKSSQIKMTIRSIRPTRTQFKLQITDHSSAETKYLNFPTQSQIVLQNSIKGWRMKLANEQYEQIMVLNMKGSNSYCLLNPDDQKVAYLVVVEISQCWNPSQPVIQSQSLHICLNIDEIISLNQFQSKVYNLVMQIDKDVFQIGAMNNSLKTRKLSSQISYVFKKQVKEIILKLVQNDSKNQVCSFKFMLKLVQKGIQKSERFLISDKDCYRLKLTVFQIRYEWAYCKPDRIVSLFTYPNKKSIQSFIELNPSTIEQRFIFWLKSNFQLTLGQIEILFNEVIGIQSGRYLQTFQRLFGNTKHDKPSNIADIFQQFIIFDLTERGFVSQTQITLIKRILQKNFKQLFSYLEKEFKQFLSSPEREGNFIIELAKMQNYTDFDYLSFLSIFQDSLQIKKEIPKKELDVKNQKSSYLGLKLISFHKLSVDGSPATLLFKISRQNLAQPIHRCYSHIYSDTTEIILKNEGNLYLQIYCQRLASQGTWQYKLIEKVVVSKQIKILGGTIIFQIRQINEKGEEVLKLKESAKQKRQLVLPQQKQDRKQNEEINTDKQDDFSKSFWNKSLNQMRQKWLTASKSGTTDKKAPRKLTKIDKEEIKKRMDVFNRQWDD